MNKLFLTIALWGFSFLFAQQDNFFYPERMGFSKGQKVSVFGDNTKLRQAPGTEAEVVALLKIGQQVEVLEGTEKTFSFNGFDSPWYQVKAGDKTGYVVGGLLAMWTESVGERRFLFNYKKSGDDFSLLIRVLEYDGEYLQKEVKLDHPNISLHAYDHKGLSGIQNIVLIDYSAEACGMEGGGAYLFYDGTGLHEAMSVSVIGDGGVYYLHEKLIFPEDSVGLERNKIIFQMDEEEVRDEESNWVERHFMTIELKWQNGKIFPEDFRKKN